MHRIIEFDIRKQADMLGHNAYIFTLVPPHLKEVKILLFVCMIEVLPWLKKKTFFFGPTLAVGSFITPFLDN